jgi:hypothetical protein
MFDFEACEIGKIKEFISINDCFSNERNEKIGLYGQTLGSTARTLLASSRLSNPITKSSANLTIKLPPFSSGIICSSYHVSST